MRPFWITYERGGTNGNSRLMDMTIPQMQKALSNSDMETPLPPASWGDMRHHVFYGALYHWFVMFRNGVCFSFPNVHHVGPNRAGFPQVKTVRCM